VKKINVIIPNYNYGEYLETCLLSVFSQKIDCNVEVLVSDDCSPDQSLGILKRFKRNFSSEKIKLTFFENSINQGEVKNTKFLLNQCDGDYIAYLDADDYWIDPYKLQKQFDFLESNPNYSLTFTGYISLQDGKYVPHAEGDYFIGVPTHLQLEEIVKPDFIAGVNNCIFSSSRFFRNYGDLALDYFDNFAYTDWPLNFELSLRGQIDYKEYPSYVYRIHQDSLSRKESKENVTISIDEWRAGTNKIFETRQNEYKLLNQLKNGNEI
jgi:glycosyltransferase involved in cell wall biosynthesis